MIDGLMAYREYKHAGLPWLPSIPARWELRRNGRLFVQRNETGFPDLPILEVSLKTGVRVRDFGESTRKQVITDREKYKVARQGDIAYNMMRMWQGAVGVAPVDGLVSPAYVVARPLPEVNSRYYQYLFRIAAYMNEVNKFSRGIVSDRNRLYWEDFKQMPSLFPPVPDQAAIVRFLDDVDRHVRRYIGAKRRLIALLNEQKQAVIQRGVTRGLNQNVRLKPSGIESLGEVPEHWETRRIKSIGRIRYGLGQPPRESEQGLPFIRATNIDHGMVVTQNLLRVDPDDVPKGRDAFLREGEIIVVRSGAYTADSAIIPKDYEGSVAGYDMVLSVLHARPQFVALALLSSYLRDHQLILSSLRAAQPHLNAEELGNSLILIPPVFEQQAIIAETKELCCAIEDAIEHANFEIDRLREYRDCLIAEVVTGKMDVREAAMELPDDIKESDAFDGEPPENEDAVNDPELDAEAEEIEA